MHFRDGYIRALALVGMAEFVQSLGGDLRKLMELAGLPLEALTDCDRLISFRHSTTMMEMAARELQRPNFGLELCAATPDHFPNIGPIVLLAQFSGDMREWLATALKSWSYHTNGFAMALIEPPDSDLATLRYLPQFTSFPSRQYVEQVIGNICRMVPLVTGHAHVRATRVRFQHSAMRDDELHQRIFGCPVDYEQERNEIVFEQRVLSLSTAGNFRFFKPLMGYYIRKRIAQLPIYDQRTTTLVKAAIKSVIGVGRCNLEFIADSLDLSPKKLQRLLAEEQSSFSEILEEVRIDLARNMLAETDASIENIAGLLDYSANAPFTLAFKRWTGHSPLNFRKRVEQ